MLKGKGVFAVIAIILVVGLGITSYTSHYINKQKSIANDSVSGFAAGAAAETTAAAAPMEAAIQNKEHAEIKAAQEQAGGGPGAAGGQAAGNAADGQGAFSVADSQPGTAAQPGGDSLIAADGNSKPETVEVQMKAGGEEGTEASQETVSEQASLVMISPLSGVLETIYEEENVAATTIVEQKEVYLKRLDELSAQIDKMWKADTDATSNSMKQTADYELKMWDNELNKIYQDVRTSLNEADAEALKQTELQWIKDRDARALAASKQVGNSSLESLEYTRTLAAITKARTYELVDIYFSGEQAAASK